MSLRRQQNRRFDQGVAGLLTSLLLSACGATPFFSGSNSGPNGFVVETVATPTFSVSEGRYVIPPNVTLSTTTSGATIHYTTDGTNPTTASSPYVSPVTVSRAQTIKAMAVRTDWINSQVASQAYTLNPSGRCTVDSDCPSGNFCNSAALCASGSDNTGGACVATDNCSYGYYCNSGTCASLTVGATAIATPAALMAISCSGNYVQTANIDMTATGFTPLCSVGGFTGTFYGNGFTISNLLYQNAFVGPVGLFGTLNGGTLAGMKVEKVDFLGFADIGGLVGSLTSGTIENSSASGSISGGSFAGGLVGSQQSVATIENSYATSSVYGDWAGGLVGLTSGPVKNSYATGSVSSDSIVGGLVGQATATAVIENSYATGFLSASAVAFVGGLVGDSNGTIRNSYATGSISAPGGTDVGGLVGFQNGGTIENSYSSGLILAAGGSNVGGLAGNQLGTVENSYATGLVLAAGGSGVGGMAGNTAGTTTTSYWDTTTSGQGVSASGIGEADPAMQIQSTYSGWDFLSTWLMSTFPILDVMPNCSDGTYGTCLSCNDGTNSISCAACTTDGNCSAGYSCASNGVGGGACHLGSDPSNAVCTFDAQCSVGYFCNFGGTCAAGNDNLAGACAANNDCSYGYACVAGVCTLQ